VLTRHKILCSMSRKGDCWDNAVAERFFPNKMDRVWQRHYANHDEARRDIAQYMSASITLCACTQPWANRVTVQAIGASDTTSGQAYSRSGLQVGAQSVPIRCKRTRMHVLGV